MTRRRAGQSERARAFRVASPNKALQLTKRGGFVGALRAPSSSMRALQLNAGVGRTLGAVSCTRGGRVTPTDGRYGRHAGHRSPGAAGHFRVVACAIALASLACPTPEERQ